MEILGYSYREKEPTPEKPVEIKNAVVCPVCYGRGFVSAGFYDSTGLTWVSTTTGNESCRSCSGKGYIVI